MTVTHRRSVLYSQNFLVDPRLVDHVLDGSTICADDVVYEIGPGEGIITHRLAMRCRQVVAVEKDPIFARRLRPQLASSPNVAIHQADFLDFPLPSTPYKVFANIPFNVTTAIVKKLTSAANPPEDAYLVVQAEAAEKYVGQPRESLFSVLLKPWFEVAIYHRFRRSDFAPAPRVDVVMLRLSKRGPPLVSAGDAQLYRDFVVHAYTAWKPTLRRAFEGIFTAEQSRQLRRELGIEPESPPTGLPFEQWLVLFYYFKMVGGRQARQLISGAEQRLRQQQEGLQKIHRTRVRRAGGSARTT